MVFARALFLYLLIAMAALLPFVHSSRSSKSPLSSLTSGSAGIPGVRSFSDGTASVKGGFERSVGKRFKDGGSFLDGEERQVPTGPDPLHHNNKPEGH